MLNRRTLLAAAASLTVLAGGLAQSDYPAAKVVTIVVPFAAGGTTDLLAASSPTGWARGSAASSSSRTGRRRRQYGCGTVARSAPDGYTLTMGTVSSHAINPGVYAKMPYDHIKDFAPISQVASVPNILMVNLDLPAKTVPELIELLKKNPGKYSFGSSGAGTSTHMAAELFKVETGTEWCMCPIARAGR